MKHILYALNGTFLMLLVPALFVLALRQLSHEANQKLVNTFGFNSQIIVGGLGIIVHELSHLIMAIIFGHHINAVSLLRIPSNTNDMSLGLAMLNILGLLHLLIKRWVMLLLALHLY